MSELICDYIPINNHTRPGLKINGVNAITLHYTANPGGTAKNHRDYFARGEVYASAHIFVDDNEARCIIPLNEVAYHANEAPCKIGYLKPNANFNSIGIEMCLDRNGCITTDTFNRTVRVVKELQATYGIKEDRIVRHFDITGKNCPAPWVANPTEFPRFKNCLANKVEEENELKLEQVKVAGVRANSIGTVKVVEATVLKKTPTGYGELVGRSVTLGEEFRVYNFDNGYYLIGDNAWVSADYCNFRPNPAIKMANASLLDKVVVSIYPDLLPLYNDPADPNAKVVGRVNNTMKYKVVGEKYLSGELFINIGGWNKASYFNIMSQN